jgi:hypothetical protein
MNRTVSDVARSQAMNFFARCIDTLILPGLLVLTVVGCTSTPPQSSQSSEPAAKQFSSPDAAVESLVDALRKEDRARLDEILAPAADDILSSGDPVADRADAARFLTLYDSRHRIQPDNDGSRNTLLVGEGEWPFPVPIVKSRGGYAFDTETGRDEILNRRIGRNELAAQQVCLAIVDAQREYVVLRPMGGALPEYARRLVSDPGRKDGLYWPTADGEQASPMGPLVASAAAQGYGPTSAPQDVPPAYHGYRYRLLTSQGPHARAGALDYLVDGRLIGGFAVVAYPAQYGNSGIMTFITNHDGIVYQRDLGPETQQVAQDLKEFDPGPEWTATADGSSVTQAD